MSVTANEPVCASEDDTRNAILDAQRTANLREFRRRARQATADLKRSAEAYDRGERDTFSRVFGRPNVRTIKAEELARRDAKQNATACPHCFAPLEIVCFYSWRGGCREVPECVDCFNKERYESLDDLKRWGWSDYGLERSLHTEDEVCAGCGRTMRFGFRHMHLRACSTDCDTRAALARRRDRRAEARAGRRCEECDELLDADRSDAKFCKGGACRQKAYRRRKSVTNSEPARSTPTGIRNGEEAG